MQLTSTLPSKAGASSHVASCRVQGFSKAFVPLRVQRFSAEGRKRVVTVEARVASPLKKLAKNVKPGKGGKGSPSGGDDGFGNPGLYGAIAAAFVGTAGLLAAAPDAASDLFFGANAFPHDYLQAALFRILALGFLSAGTVSYVQKIAAEEGSLDEDLHRRLNGSLSFFAASNLGISSVDLATNHILQPAALLALGSVSALTWWVAGRDYARYSPEGANPVAILKSYFKDASNTFEVDGAISLVYAVLTANFLLAGFGYLFAPGPSLAGVFGDAVAKGPEDQWLWQLAGAGLATAVGPLTYSLKKAANNNIFSAPTNRLLNAGLSGASLGHLAVLLPLFGTDKAGPLLPLLLGVWGTSAVTSTLITAKPKE